MDKKGIIEYLEESGIEEIEEIEYKEETAVFRLYYDFDNDELASARAYANDECEEEKEGETWYDEFFLPYLNDIAIDNVGEFMEEIIEKFGVEVQYITYETDKESYNYCEFIAAVAKKGEHIDIESILDELEL